MKRITILTLVLFLVTSFSTQPIHASEALEGVIETIEGLGLTQSISDQPLPPENPITRAQMAQIIQNIYTYQGKGETSWTFFGTDNNTLLMPDQSQETVIFSDVMQNYRFYEAIQFVNSIGIMNGTGDGLFQPERELKTTEAVKILVCILGYDIKGRLYGGYPTGYMQTAAELNIYRNTQTPSEISYFALCQMLFKALEVRLLEIKSISTTNNYETSDETILSHFMGLKKITAIMTQNETTSFTGYSKIGNGYVEIGGVVLKLPEKSKHLSAYVGRSVTAYYSEEQLVYGILSGKDNAVTFSLKDFVSYKDGVIAYVSNNRTQTVSIINGAAFIYNGLAVTNYGEQNFNHENGTVTIVSTSNASYDLVIVEGYDSYFRGDGEPTELIPYYEILKEKTEHAVILSQDGDIITYDDIPINCVLDVSANQDVIKVIVSSEIVSGFTLSSIDRTGGIIYGDQQYSISKRLLENTHNITLGTDYQLHMNSFGQVVFMDTDDNSAFKLSYVSKFALDSNSLEQVVKAKILVGEKKFKVFQLKPKIAFSDENGNDNIQVNSLDVLQKLISFEDSAIRYRVNEYDQIIEIELPLKIGIASQKPTRLFTMIDAKEDSKVNYSRQQRCFGGTAFIKDNASYILNIPANRDDEQKYSFITAENLEQTGYVLKAYGVNPKSPMAAYVCLSIDAKTNLGDQNYPVVVLKISKVQDQDGQMINKLVVFRLGREEILYDIEENDLINKAVDSTNPNPTEADYYKVSVGDIIRCTTDSDNYINYIEMLFDADGTYDNSKYLDYVTEADNLDINFKHTQKGILAGTIGYYSPTISNTNPLATLKKIGTVTNNNANLFNSGAPRFILGYVYRVFDSYVTYTTQNIGEEEYDPNNPKYITESREANFTTTTVTYKNGTVTCKAGNVGDLRSYMDYGIDFSRIIVMTASYDKRYMIIINGEM